MSTLNECQKRRYLGTEALALGKGGADKDSEYFEISKNTIYRSIREIKSGYAPEQGRIRRPGGGRKRLPESHPEWFDTLRLIIEPRTAGLPQDEDVIRVSMSVPQITREMSKVGCDVSEYIVRQILDKMGFRHRSFIKDLPMKDVKDRDTQFRNIAGIREAATAVGLPIISIDTEKKELIGNFKREGKALTTGQPKSLDHDFATFSDGQIVPHGIYDVTKNVGCMTIGTGHDTSGFVCDNVKRAEETTTSKGLTVYVDINDKTYDIQRPIDKSFEKDLKKRIVFQESLPKWNYLIKRS